MIIGNVNVAENNPAAFMKMKRMENDDACKLVSNQSPFVEIRDEEWILYRKKYTKMTGKERPEFMDDERRSMGRKVKNPNRRHLSLIGSSLSSDTELGGTGHCLPTNPCGKALVVCTVFLERNILLASMQIANRALSCFSSK